VLVGVVVAVWLLLGVLLGVWVLVCPGGKERGTRGKREMNERELALGRNSHVNYKPKGKEKRTAVKLGVAVREAVLEAETVGDCVGVCVAWSGVEKRERRTNTLRRTNHVSILSLSLSFSLPPPPPPNPRAPTGSVSEFVLKTQWYSESHSRWG